MSHLLFTLSAKTKVPLELVSAHSTLPQPSIYVLHGLCTEELKLIRLLLGNIRLTYHDGFAWTQSVDYSRMGAVKNASTSMKSLDAQLAVFGIVAADLNVLLQKTLNQRNYYGDLLAEALHFFLRTRRGEHALAFLHCYRFLEHIAFAFPMLYASRSPNFVKAFAQLKDFFSGATSEGELRFFERFIEASLDLAVREQTISIDFGSVDPAFAVKTFSVVKNQFKPADVVSENVGVSIEVKCQGLTSACANLRNRFFHFRATEPANISVNAIGVPDQMFEAVNNHIFNWLSFIYFETLKHRVNTSSSPA